MREIKFRAWDKQDKIMWEPLTLNDLLQGRWELETADQSSSLPHSDYLCFGHEDTVWMQFTGLKDKNGKEIWEGDIVDYAVKKMICPVCSKKDIESRLNLHSEQYCPGCGTKTVYSDFVTRAEVVYEKAAFGYRKTLTDNSYQCWPVYANEIYIEWVEVVGNIHEGIAKVESNVHPVIADVLNQLGLTT